MIDIGDLTTRAAWRAPGRDAIIDVPNGRRLSFAQLEERANRLARGLRDELGIGPGERVAILSTNAAEIAETFFACAKAGLVAMPLNWRLAVPEQARILADGEPAALISNREFAAEVGELQGRNDIAHWIEFAPGADSAYEELLAHCIETIPRFAVPRYVRIVDALPKTPSHRIQKFKLRSEGITPDTVDREALGIRVPRS